MHRCDCCRRRVRAKRSQALTSKSSVIQMAPPLGWCMTAEARWPSFARHGMYKEAYTAASETGVVGNWVLYSNSPSPS